ncbi:hypothetical protein Q5424_11975 [Conexibacter sp. JD483]|uniref:hypothetical protein n=1 Tax=unclassified Conexibacter TaxID=2627773 RepID=UPI00272411CE|nr:MULTISPECIES: hypothetical protein [unclassified Conexibacter]MDO8188037.1 hypothetical protein [Conexibacter sp. CPCC 205706]MDO8200459.1 hypothetical protein [Conexibacter sp. CPCC 205762]MDR9369806.1 hypothetical protein [Conexibacter sp. JD483]
MRVVTTQGETEAAIDDGESAVASMLERGLFRSALDFYGAAEAVIDYHGPDRPKLRFDLDGLGGVRAAMGALERRIAVASRAGFSTERIIRITRLEPEIVEGIIARERARSAG